MDAQRIVQNCVLKNQSTVIEEMIRANLISEEYLYPFVDDVMEWWLIDSWLAERLKAQGEVIIEEYGCYWWGRQSSGQAIYMDGVIQEICGNDSPNLQLTKFRFHSVNYWIETLFFRNLIRQQSRKAGQGHCVFRICFLPLWMTY